MAKYVLGIPASSAKSERVFSAGGLTVTPTRHGLNEDKIEDLVFLSLNLPLLSDKELEEGAKRARLDTIEEEDF